MLLVALLLGLLALLPGSGAQATVDYSALLTKPVTTHGRQKKGAASPASKWDKASFNDTEFVNWLAQTAIYTLHQKVEVPRVFPLSSHCGVWVSHKRKLLLLVQRLAGAVSLLDGWGRCKALKQKQDKAGCMELLTAEDLQSSAASAGADPAAALDTMWRSYFVMSVVRNPYARAASVYEHLINKWSKRGGPCTPPSFDEFCRDPSVLGKTSNLFRCFGRDALWLHDFRAVEPIAPCLLNDKGELVVDYLIRSENLKEDLAAAIAAANEGRPEDQQLRMPSGWTDDRLEDDDAIKHGVMSSTHPLLLRHAGMFEECGEKCKQWLDEFYAADIKLLFGE